VTSPGGSDGGASVVLVALAGKTTVFAPSGGNTAELTVLVLHAADPVDPSIVTDSLVERINEDDLVVLVRRILVDPVRVEDTKTTALAANLLLGTSTHVTSRLELSDTLVHGLAASMTLPVLPLPVPATDPDPVHDVPLLGLVPEATGLIRAGRPGEAKQAAELAVLPATDTREEAEHIALDGSTFCLMLCYLLQQLSQH